MKKLLALFLCALALFSLSACTTQADVEAAYQRGLRAGYEDGYDDGYDNARERYNFNFRCPIDPEDYEQAYNDLETVLFALEENYSNGTPFDVGMAFTLLDDARSTFWKTWEYLAPQWGW